MKFATETPGIDEEPGLRALIGRERQEVLAVQRHRATRDRVIRMARDREGERRFAAAVGAHERVHAPRLDVEIDPFEDAVAFDAGLKVRNVKSAFAHIGSIVPGRA